GDWSWVGHLDGEDPDYSDTLLTFGAKAVFGQIAQPGAMAPPLKIATRRGSLWLGETTITSRVTDKPLLSENDGIATPLPSGGDSLLLRDASALAAEKSGQQVVAVGVIPVVDVLIGYTKGFRATFGSDSATVTRLNNVVDEMNVVLANSGVNGRVRLVATTY